MAFPMDSSDQLLTPVQRRASHMMLPVVALLLLLSLLIGVLYGQWLTAAAIGLPTAALTLAAIWQAPAALSTRLIVAGGLMIFSALQIHLLGGQIEAHFMIFILLSLLLIYRDWRPIVLAAAVIATHHLLFGYLQSLGGPVRVMPEQHMHHLLPMVLVHALYVIFQTALLLAMSRAMRREAIAGSELGNMSTHIGRQEGQFDLSFDDRPMRSRLGQSFQHTMHAVRRTLAEVVDSVLTLSRTEGEIADGNRQLAERSRDQNTSLEHAGTLIDALGRRVHDTSANADAASEHIRRNTELIVESCAGLEELAGTMNRMRESSGHIAEVTDLIDNIAFQTRILALNASIEAARAGISGRGFAVVAREVGTLAQKSAEASRQIADTIETTRHQILDNSTRADEVNNRMEQVRVQMQEINTLMDDIRHAGADQRERIDHLGEDIAAIGEGTRHNAALADTLREDVETLGGQTQRLREVLKVFVIRDDKAALGYRRGN